MLTSPPLETDSCRLIVGDSEHNADMLYAVGVMVPDPFVWMRTNSETLVVVSGMEVNRVRATVPSEVTVLSRRDAAKRCGLDPSANPPLTRLLPHLLSQVGCIRCRVPKDFPVYLADALRSPNVEVTVDTPFFPQRASKTHFEIEAVRDAVELAEAGLQHALNILEQSEIRADRRLTWSGDTSAVLTAEVLQGEINAQIARLGGAAGHTITACGVQGADPHLAGTGPLTAGEPIVIDIFPRMNRTGYHGDLTRTVVKGTATERVRAAFRAVYQAQADAINAAGPGIPVRDVHRAAAAAIKNAGFDTDATCSPPHGFIHGTGHGLGLQVHEDPRVSDTDGTLEKGHVITIEPGIYQPEWGGVRLEDVIAVTKDGAVNLTTAKKVLEIC